MGIFKGNFGEKGVLGGFEGLTVFEGSSDFGGGVVLEVGVGLRVMKGEYKGIAGFGKQGG